MTDEATEQVRRVHVPERMDGERVDRVLAALMPEYSRSRLQTWIKAGHVRLAGRRPRPRDTARAGDEIEVRTVAEPSDEVEAQAIPVEVVYEDAHLLVVNKPPGLVVHPGAGNPDRTLQNALLHHDPELARLPRAGLVHRLDKDTSGLLLVARDLGAHNALVKAMQARHIHREYLAVVHGLMTAGGRVDQPLGRHPRDRVRMGVRPRGRRAVTQYRVLERFRAHTLLRVNLETGRTHQIRVHMAWLRFPIVGDPLYGTNAGLPQGVTPELGEMLGSFRRQALHARQLQLQHPITGASLALEAPVPDDMQALIEALRADAHEVPEGLARSGTGSG